MAALKINHFSFRFPSYYKSLFCRNTQHTTRFNCFKNLKIKHKHSFIPIFQTKAVKNSYFSEVSYSSKLTRKKPLNLESTVDYERVSEETLQSLYDRFEELLENSCYGDCDVNYSNGVLTATLEASCVYVINKQTPNRQIWLSSPKSGPKRYDYVNGVWIYKHDGVSLHKLLSNELTELLQKEADFFVCTYSS